MIKEWFKQGVDGRSLLLIFAAVFLFFSTSLFIQARSIIIHPETSDFSAYFSAYIIRAELGEGIYEQERFFSLEASESVTAGVREYLYSPLFADVLSVFMPTDYTQARLWWLVIEHLSIFLLFVLSGLILRKAVGASKVGAFMVSALLIVSFSAIERSFHYGQASAVVALLLFFAAYLHALGRTYTATFFAAFGAILKVYPIIYLVALIIKGHFREAAVMVFFMVLIVAASMALFGVYDWAQFLGFHSSNPLVDRETGMAGGAVALLYEIPNYAPTALLFLLSDQMGWGWTQTAIWEVVRVAVLVVALGIYTLLWRRIYGSFGFLQTVALGLIGVMLISPLLWNHVFIMFIPIYAILMYRSVVDPDCSFGSFLWLLVSFGLVAFPDFMTNAGLTNHGLMVLLKYTKLYGVLILAYFLCFSAYAQEWRQIGHGTAVEYGR